MRVISLKIDQSFQDKRTQEILTQLDYSPIWQDIEWTKMLLRANYAKEGFFIGIEENNKLALYGIIEKRSIGLNQY